MLHPRGQTAPKQGSKSRQGNGSDVSSATDQLQVIQQTNLSLISASSPRRSFNPELSRRQRRQPLTQCTPRILPNSRQQCSTTQFPRSEQLGGGGDHGECTKAMLWRLTCDTARLRRCLPTLDAHLAFDPAPRSPLTNNISTLSIRIITYGLTKAPVVMMTL